MSILKAVKKDGFGRLFERRPRNTLKVDVKEFREDKGA